MRHVYRPGGAKFLSPPLVGEKDTKLPIIDHAIERPILSPLHGLEGAVPPLRRRTVAFQDTGVDSNAIQPEGILCGSDISGRRCHPPL